MNVKEYRLEKCWITVFGETGDVFIQTDGDIHVLKCKRLFCSEEIETDKEEKT